VKQSFAGDAMVGTVLLIMMLLSARLLSAQSAVPAGLLDARKALAAKEYQRAKGMFSGYLRVHPGSIDAEEGVGDAELGLHEYERAELEYRKVVATQPQFWLAHKNLVIVEAALGRWEEFDRERALLREARQRGAPGISARESDVIDSFDAGGHHWIVREYYEPAGRSLTRYNFEFFGPDGRVREYVSLESADAARNALAVGGQVHIGDDAKVPASIKDFALNFYTGNAHGTITRYPNGEPKYERVRSDVVRWLRQSKGVKPTT
jgi:tetratricopeptide (TPR) repeat protein